MTALGSNLAHMEVLGGRDGFLPYDHPERLKASLQSMIDVEPDLVLTHRREDLHQDHAFAAELAWQLFRTARIVEYEVPKYEGDVGPANLYVPLDRSVAEAKVTGLMQHFPSQLEHPWFAPQTFWALLHLRGIECHAPSGCAEAFTCRKVVV